MSDVKLSPHQVLQQFFRDNSLAVQLLHVATDDYAAARCLLLNLLTGGLVMGAQAMEKYMKAFILFHDPQQKVRGLSHSLPELLEQAARFLPELVPKFSALAAKFSRHYDTRYPDNPNRSGYRTTADLIELDEFIVFLNENMACPLHVRYRTGFYVSVTFSVDHGHASVLETWIKNNNHALAPLLPNINVTQAIILKELHG